MAYANTKHESEDAKKCLHMSVERGLEDLSIAWARPCPASTRGLKPHRGRTIEPSQRRICLLLFSFPSRPLYDLVINQPSLKPPLPPHLHVFQRETLREDMGFTVTQRELSRDAIGLEFVVEEGALIGRSSQHAFNLLLEHHAKRPLNCLSRAMVRGAALSLAYNRSRCSRCEFHPLVNMRCRERETSSVLRVTLHQTTSRGLRFSYK